MNVTWQGNVIPVRVKPDLSCAYFRPGDFVLVQGSLMRVHAVQTGFAIEDLHRFLMITLEDREGNLTPVRNLGKKYVQRPIRKG